MNGLSSVSKQYPHHPYSRVAIKHAVALKIQRASPIIVEFIRFMEDQKIFIVLNQKRRDLYQLRWLENRFVQTRPEIVQEAEDGGKKVTDGLS